MVPGGKVGIKLKSKGNVIFFRAGTHAKSGATPKYFRKPALALGCCSSPMTNASLSDYSEDMKEKRRPRAPFVSLKECS